MAIQEMNLTIKHWSGHSNASADALSRNPVSESEPAVVCAFDTSLGETEEGDDASPLNFQMPQSKNLVTFLNSRNLILH